MSASSISHLDSSAAPRGAGLARRVAGARAVLALVWAAALFAVVGGNEPATTVAVATGVAALLAGYPLIDLVSSLINAQGDPSSRRILWLNAALGAAAVAALAGTGFGSDAQATVTSFGVWASLSGALQLGVAIHHRRATGGQVPMIISGGLSTLAGINFIAGAGGHTAHLTSIAGYMTLGAVLYVVWTVRERTRAGAADGGSAR